VPCTQACARAQGEGGGGRAGEAHHARAVRAAAVPGRRRAQDCQRVAAAQQRGKSHQCGTHASGCCRARLRRARATLHAKHAEPLHACRLPDWTPFGRLLHVAEPCHSSAPGRACQMYDSNTLTASHSCLPQGAIIGERQCTSTYTSRPPNPKLPVSRHPASTNAARH